MQNLDKDNQIIILFKKNEVQMKISCKISMKSVIFLCSGNGKRNQEYLWNLHIFLLLSWHLSLS